MHIFNIRHEETLNRPGWKRTIETAGQSVVIRVFNEKRLEAARIWIPRESFDMVLQAIDLARRLGEGQRELVGQLHRRDGAYFNVSAGNYEGRAELSLRLFDEDGSEVGRTRSITEIEPLEGVIRQQLQCIAARAGKQQAAVAATTESR